MNEEHAMNREALQERADVLKKEIDDIELQLSLDKRVQEMPPADYKAWRDKAMIALHIKKEERDDLLAELRRMPRSVTVDVEVLTNDELVGVMQDAMRELVERMPSQR